MLIFIIILFPFISAVLIHPLSLISIWIVSEVLALAILFMSQLVIPQASNTTAISSHVHCYALF